MLCLSATIIHALGCVACLIAFARSDKCSWVRINAYAAISASSLEVLVDIGAASQLLAPELLTVSQSLEAAVWSKS